jgi:hypothetical protein
VAQQPLLILVLGLIAGAVAARLYGAYRWRVGTRALRARLDAAREPVRPSVVDFHELEGLPAPVQRYFRTALSDGQPMVTGVRIQHRGTFNLGDTADRWKRFASDQMVVTRRPGFDWNARVLVLPGVAVQVHDAYSAGEGLLHASLLGLVPLVLLRGTEDLARGELMRFFAEAAWYPTALLPSQGVRWAAGDERSAYGTLTDGTISLTLLFRFDEHGLIESARAEARGRTVGGKVIPTPWQGRQWNYEERQGMTVPLEGEVSWLLPDGPHPYWRGRITRLDYELTAQR